MLLLRSRSMSGSFMSHSSNVSISFLHASDLHGFCTVVLHSCLPEMIHRYNAQCRPYVSRKGPGYDGVRS